MPRPFHILVFRKMNLIETIGFKLDRHGSTATEAIVHKSITIRLDDKVGGQQ